MGTAVVLGRVGIFSRSPVTVEVPLSLPPQSLLFLRNCIFIEKCTSPVPPDLSHPPTPVLFSLPPRNLFFFLTKKKEKKKILEFVKNCHFLCLSARKGVDPAPSHQLFREGNQPGVGTLGPEAGLGRTFRAHFRARAHRLSSSCSSPPPRPYHLLTTSSPPHHLVFTTSPPPPRPHVLTTSSPLPPHHVLSSHPHYHLVLSPPPCPYHLTTSSSPLHHLVLTTTSFSPRPYHLLTTSSPPCPYHLTTLSLPPHHLLLVLTSSPLPRPHRLLTTSSPPRPYHLTNFNLPPHHLLLILTSSPPPRPYHLTTSSPHILTTTSSSHHLLALTTSPPRPLFTTSSSPPPHLLLVLTTTSFSPPPPHSTSLLAAPCWPRLTFEEPKVAPGCRACERVARTPTPPKWKACGEGRAGAHWSHAGRFAKTERHTEWLPEPDFCVSVCAKGLSPLFFLLLQPAPPPALQMQTHLLCCSVQY
ncbi:uncharacterized protein M6D78_006917 [Vipera latastei]